jgi:thiol:disulfide interchange protein
MSFGVTKRIQTPIPDRRTRSLLFVLAVLCFITACGRVERTASQAFAGPSSDSESKIHSGESRTLAVLTLAQLKQRIASQKGRVVVVDLWALW